MQWLQNSAKYIKQGKQANFRSANYAQMLGVDVYSSSVGEKKRNSQKNSREKSKVGRIETF